MNGNLHDHYAHKELPGIDCIFYPDDAVILLDAHSNALCDTTIPSLEKYLGDIWTEIDFYPDHLLLQDGSIFRFGEGSMGNEGFIVLENEYGDIRWAYFTTHFNPFNKLLSTVTGDVQAHSTNGYVLTFNINEPWKIEVQYSVS